ncbi:MAG: carbohydrate ABC transporter permease [Eubacteriales bacterium]|jgi:multiple sugar transport system permease protein
MNGQIQADKQKKIKKYTKIELQERKNTLFFLIPSLAGVMLFYILPFAVVIYYSLIDNPIQKNFVGFSNFKQVFTNSAFRQAAGNTLKFSVIAVPLVVLLSLLLAILLDTNIPFKTQFRTAFITPLMVPVASIVLIVQVLFDYNGAFNTLLANFGILPIDWLKSDYAYLVIVTLYLWKNLGYNMILFMSALSNIPTEILEVATLDGCGGLRKFFYIKLRYLISTIMFVTILSLINSFKVFREVYLLTGDYPNSLYMLQHFMNNTFKSLDYQKLSAAAVIIGILMVLLINLLFAIDRHFSGGEDD